MLIALRFALAAILGFVLPGYLLAGLLRSEGRWRWAFPLSLILLFWAVFAAGIFGLPVTGPVVGVLLIGEILVIRLLKKWRRRSLSQNAKRAPMTALARRLLWGLYPLVALVFLRTALWPLAGYDTSFRWDFLARQMLGEHSFRFYPPISAADYRIYFYTDGIPPLVSFSYWWLYTAAGGWHPPLTSLLVIAQLIAILWFTYSIGMKSHSALAGVLAAGILGGSTLFVHSVAIGQETGLTALSIAAMFDCVIGRRDRPAMVLAGLAAALGALSREYGCAIPIIGAVAVLWLGGGWRNAAILVVTAAIAAGPWYLRNAVLAGNPLYSNRFGPFPVNAMHVAILDYYRTYIGVSTWDAKQWRTVALSLIEQAPLQCTLGVAAAGIFFRKAVFFGLAAAVFVVLWLDSIGYTSGNWPYAMRVLTPALVALSILAGRLIAAARQRWVGIAAVAGCLAWSIAAATVYPFEPTEPSIFRHWTEVVRTTARPEGRWWVGLPKVVHAGSRVLCVNPYIAAGLRGSGIDFVPVWSPEVSFISDPAVPAQTMRQRLIDRGIRYAVVENDPNGRYLANNVPFYHADMRNWTVIATAGADASVYELPAPGN
jgi:hypothetical protein